MGLRVLPQRRQGLLELPALISDPSPGPPHPAASSRPMTELERIAWLGRSLAASAERLRRYANMPQAPEMIVAHERSIFEKRWVQLSEIADFGDRAGWSSEAIHDAMPRWGPRRGHQPPAKGLIRAGPRRSSRSPAHRVP